MPQPARLPSKSRRGLPLEETAKHSCSTQNKQLVVKLLHQEEAQSGNGGNRKAGGATAHQAHVAGSPGAALTEVAPDISDVLCRAATSISQALLIAKGVGRAAPAPGRRRGHRT